MKEARLGVFVAVCISCIGTLTTVATEPQDVAFIAARDQTEQRYVRVLPESYEATLPHDILIFLHGHGSDRWQGIRSDRGEIRAARDTAQRYRMIFVSPDYRADASWMGPAAEADLIQIIGDLKKQYSIRKVVLSGASMGAASALTFAALHPEMVHGVVALNGHANHVEYTNFQESITASFGGSKQKTPHEYRQRSPEFFPWKFTMPLAITAGGKDTIVPPESVVRLGRAVQKHNPATLVDYSETRGHSTSYEDSLEAYDFVMRAQPALLRVAINGKDVLPAPGSAAGVWFYAAEEGGPQLLLTGHRTVAGSWRMITALNNRDEILITLYPNALDKLSLDFEEENLGVNMLTTFIKTNVLVIKATSGPGAVRLTRFTSSAQSINFAPERRSLSREPFPCSPDLRPEIAEALVEWDWRMQDGIETPREPRTYRQALEKIVRQMDAMTGDAEFTRSLTPAALTRWFHLRKAPLPKGDDDSALEKRWREAHKLRRQLVLSNRHFGSQPLVFLKHVPSVMSHQLTQAYGYCARPGGGLFILEEPDRSMRIRNITPPSLPSGNFMTPELSYDAERLFFAYAPVKQSPVSWDYNDQTKGVRYQIHELSLKSGNVRVLTDGDTDNFSPLALPSGEMLFISTRRGGYHRCGRGPCFVYTLARMDGDGKNARSVSFHETHEWDPSLLNDGRVIYTRWDYVDRNAVHYQQLWSALPDGGGARIFYGNNTWNPAGIWEARAVPGSSLVMATAAPHHGLSAGSIILVDTSRGVDGKEPITRLTPDARFPETESPLLIGVPSPAAFDFDTPVAPIWGGGFQDPAREQKVPEEENRWPGHCYKSPWPLSEKAFIVSYSFDSLIGEPGPNLPNMFGIYFADAFGNKELIYRDPAISSVWARPLAPRNPPPTLVADVSTPYGEEESRYTPDTGTFFLSNVMESWPTLPSELPITHLRIVQVLLKTTPNAESPRLGAAFASPGKQVLGTVPVESDGSAFFEAPARTPILFQALDSKGRAVQTMRSLVYLQPGERQSCVGCHERRTSASLPSSRMSLALNRSPSKIKPAPEGSRPFSYPLLVQPILDKHCVSCHDGKEPKRPVLTSEPEGDFTKSYNALVARVSFTAWSRPENNYEPLTEPLRFGALGSPLAKMLEQGHKDVKLSPEEEERLVTWMDANALFYGTFDVSEQKKQLRGEKIHEP